MLPRINQILLQNSWKLLIFSLHMHPPSSWYCLKSSVSSFCTLPSVPSPLSLVGTDAAGLLRTFPPLEPRHKAQYFVPSEFSSPFCPGLIKKKGFTFHPCVPAGTLQVCLGYSKKMKGCHCPALTDFVPSDTHPLLYVTMVWALGRAICLIPAIISDREKETSDVDHQEKQV